MGRDDAILLPVRVVAAIIVVVLVLAVIVLYGMPTETERFWAWTIGAPMTALLMGVGYAAGTYFFTRAFTSRSWRSVSLGFPSITVFTTLLLIATVLHWEKFNHGHIAFFAWAFLYAVTPVLIPALWLINRQRDPGRETTDLLVPLWSRSVLALSGAAISALALVLFIAPSVMMPDWPWQLTPLTARTVAAYVGLTGSSLALIAIDGRWRAAKVLIESLIIGVALTVVAILRAWDTLDPATEVRWALLGGIGLGLLSLLGLYGGMERRYRTVSLAAREEPVPPEEHVA